MLLFEFYAQYIAPPAVATFGTYSDWQRLGQAFAQHAMPGGLWATANHAPASYGVTMYSAINEPDGGSGNYSFVAGGQPGPAAYAAALAGLSAGVKAACAACAVAPGGFMSVNANGDPTLHGLGPYLAPLWNNGSLDALDLHTYYDVQYAPMEGTYSHSAQANFDAVKQSNGITAAGLRFHSTEYNYKKRLVTEDQAALGFLTGMWDQLGAVGTSRTAARPGEDCANEAGSSTSDVPIAALAFPWNIFDTTASDTDYGLAVTDVPYVPTSRGNTLAMALALLASSGSQGGWGWISSDPRGTGLMVLQPQASGAPSTAATLCANPSVSICSGAGPRQLTVWQDRPAWTSLPDTHAINITALPTGCTTVDTYGWDGYRSSVPVSAASNSAYISGLPGTETYVFMAHDGSCGQWHWNG